MARIRRNLCLALAGVLLTLLPRSGVVALWLLRTSAELGSAYNMKGIASVIFVEGLTPGSIGLSELGFIPLVATVRQGPRTSQRQRNASARGHVLCPRLRRPEYLRHSLAPSGRGTLGACVLCCDYSVRFPSGHSGGAAHAGLNWCNVHGAEFYWIVPSKAPPKRLSMLHRLHARAKH